MAVSFSSDSFFFVKTTIEANRSIWRPSWLLGLVDLQWCLWLSTYAWYNCMMAVPPEPSLRRTVCSMAPANSF